MQNIGTWLAISGVAIGFVVLLYLLFKAPPSRKKPGSPGDHN
jgi:hypothetical protein